jgi:hypothetical protein
MTVVGMRERITAIAAAGRIGNFMGIIASQQRAERDG